MFTFRNCLGHYVKLNLSNHVLILDGENLYKRWPSYRYYSVSNAWSEILEGWWDEIKDYKTTSNPPIVTWENYYKTGHFTQMAWASTTKVGCGWTHCHGNAYTIAVCNYSPR